MGRAERLLAQGEKRFERWLSTQSPADLEAAVTALTEAEALAPANDRTRLAVDGMLGFALASRYQQSQSPGDLDGAIRCLGRVAAVPAASGDFDGVHLLLGFSLASRIELYGQPGGPALPSDEEFLAELTTAIGSLAVAAQSTSASVLPGDRARAAEVRAFLLPKLVIARAMATRKAGGLADDRELEHGLRGLPAGHPDRSRLLLELGLAHMGRYTGDITSGILSSAHLEPTISYLSEAMDLLGSAEPALPTLVGYLVFIHLGRLRLTSSPEPDEQARQVVARLLANPAVDSEVAAALHVLTAIDRDASSAAAVSEAVEHLNRAQHLAPEHEPLRALALATFAALAGDMRTPSRSLDDRDAADTAYAQLLELASRPGMLPTAGEAGGSLAQLTHPALQQAQRAGEVMSRALLERDLPGVDAALGQLGQLLMELAPEGEPWWMVQHLIGAGWRMRGALSGDQSDTVRGLRAELAALKVAETSTLVRLTSSDRLVRRLMASAAAELGWLAADQAALNAAIARMRTAGDDPSMTPAERAEWSWQCGIALIRRHELTGRPSDRDDGISLLEQAARAADDLDLGGADYAQAQNLSVAYWARGDRAHRDQERAIDTGMLALRQRAATVLLQSGAPQGLRLARWHGFTQVVQLVNWCLAEGRVLQAVQALELGRALVLHAATVTADIPALLTAAGHEPLAGEWLAQAAHSAPVSSGTPSQLLWPGSPGPDVPVLRVPSALRRRVLGALRAEPVLAVPDLPELTQALRRAEADAFVYLLPPLAGRDGRALTLSVRGGLGQLALPGLDDAAPLDSYEAAVREAAGNGWAGRRAWADALGTLCDWAWTAAVAPLLDQAASWQLGRAPRLVVIPVGRLSLVPWHAARTTRPGGQPHYAVQDALFCYAAAAGQLGRATARPRRPASAAPVLVANPTGDLRQAELEVAELKRRYYPGAAYLGHPAELATGPATRAQVLSRLPGGTGLLASLLHCGCHADVAAPLTDSHLLLDGNQQLRIADILGQAQRHDPDGPGFLAVLSACMTDLANADHDEALTLSSALLAAGASGVVGARWPVSDDVTALLMLMFHHYLSSSHPHPADALRAAQLWMLDSERTVLDGLPAHLTDGARSSFLAKPYSWAAFTYQGS